MLERLFLPAIHIMDRFSYSRKFLLLGLLSISVLTILSFNLTAQLNSTINTIQTQLIGIEQLKTISKSIQSMQKHRGQSAGQVVGNDKEIFENRDTIRHAINHEFENIEKQLPQALLTESDWKTIKNRWQYLQKTDVTIGLNDNFVSHSKLIAKLIRLQRIVADYYKLTILAETDSYYLLNTALTELTALTETLGKIRAKGIVILVSKETNYQTLTELEILVATLKSELKDLRINLNTAGHHAPSINQTLHQATDEINDSARQMIVLIKSDILSGKLSTSPQSFFIKTSQFIDIAFDHLRDTLLFNLEQQLNRKSFYANKTFCIIISLAVVIILLVSYFAYGIYYSTIHSISDLTRSARAIADGNFDTRLSLKSHDELQQVGISFNHMADQVTKLLDSERQALAVLSIQQANLEAFFENMDSAVVIYSTLANDEGFIVNAINRAAERIEKSKRQDIVGKNVNSVFPYVKQSGLMDILLDVKQTGIARDYPIVHYQENHIASWREHYVYRLPNNDIVVIYKDVTQKKQSEEALELASLVYQNSSEAMMVTDSDNKIIAINPAFTEMTGYTENDAIGNNPNILSSHKQNSHFYRQMWSVLKERGEWQGEVWNKHKSGNEFLEWLTINTIKRNSGEVYRYVALFADITEKKKTEELVWQQANFDSLTKLPNRRMFRDRLKFELKKFGRDQLPLALLFLDLDHFKEINDTLGHESGDELLIEAGKRITNNVRESDTVARIGGDEFTIILAELTELHVVEQIADKIIQVLNQPFDISNGQVYVSASIGITLCPNDATTVSGLLKNADQAMYLAKELGRNRFCYFTPQMQQHAQKRLGILNELHHAIEKEQFQLYFQPIVDLKTNKISKAEALIRWLHPERGLISPVDFIPIAEESGLINEIGDWVFKQAVQQAKYIKTSLEQNIQISVNKSPLQFKGTESHSDWLEYLEQHQVSGNNIVIEITESLLMEDKNDITNQLNEFKAAGLTIAMDDFGTGYSSLSYLKKFDIDYLKIDRSFINNMTANSDDMALSEAIIVMAHRLGIKVIAEGIETQEQMDLLSAVGCDFGQGYLFSKPLPAQDFHALLAKKA